MNVTIIGLGWLGQGLALAMHNAGYAVTGTVTTQHKAEQINQRLPINALQFDCYAPLNQTLSKRLFHDRTLIINIAAGKRNVCHRSYYDAITRMVDCAIDAGVIQIVFVSTISVFGGQDGPIKNDTALSPVTESALAHTKIEQMLLTKYAKKSCVLRLAGLTGANPDVGYRHPIYALQNKGLVELANHPVNLVHKHDVIRAIMVICERMLTGVALNLCSTDHPTKHAYYTWCAQQLDIPMLQFKQSNTIGKQILANQTLTLLDMQLVYSSPYDMLPLTD